MGAAASFRLDELLRATNAADREAAWDELISGHTRLILAVARSFGADHDEAMERYTFILGKLRESDFHRLRAFEPQAGASFSTWLAVTVRRLCLDFHRQRYGRQRPTLSNERSQNLRRLRRSLADSAGAEINIDLLPDSGSLDPDSWAIAAERNSIIQRELSRLTPRERLLLALRFDDDLSASKIATILGLPTPFHVYRQLNHVLARLRVALQARGVDDTA